jgi:hypothetical protein
MYVPHDYIFLLLYHIVRRDAKSVFYDTSSQGSWKELFNARAEDNYNTVQHIFFCWIIAGDYIILVR